MFLIASGMLRLTEHILGACGPDDDLSPHGGHADLNARVSILSQLPVEELVQLGIEDAVRDELRPGRQ